MTGSDLWPRAYFVSNANEGPSRLKVQSNEAEVAMLVTAVLASVLSRTLCSTIAYSTHELLRKPVSLSKLSSVSTVEQIRIAGWSGTSTFDSRLGIGHDISALPHKYTRRLKARAALASRLGTFSSIAQVAPHIDHLLENQENVESDQSSGLCLHVSFLYENSGAHEMSSGTASWFRGQMLYQIGPDTSVPRARHPC